jgi:hypothetical protein
MSLTSLDTSSCKICWLLLKEQVFNGEELETHLTYPVQSSARLPADVTVGSRGFPRILQACDYMRKRLKK